MEQDSHTDPQKNHPTNTLMIRFLASRAMREEISVDLSYQAYGTLLGQP